MIMFVQESGPSFNFNKARDICKVQLQDVARVQLIYGHAGW